MKGRRSLAMLGVGRPHCLGLRDCPFTLSAGEDPGEVSLEKWGGKQALPYLWPRVTLGK